MKQQRKPDHCMRTGVCVHVSSIALFCCPPKTEGGNKQQQTTTTTSNAKRPLPTNEGDPLDQAGDQVRNRGRDGVLSLGLCSRAVGGRGLARLPPGTLAGRGWRLYPSLKREIAPWFPILATSARRTARHAFRSLSLAPCGQPGLQSSIMAWAWH